MQKRFGFTIVEVLVVIGIIALLTVIIYPSLSDIRKKNRDAEKVSDISVIQMGLSLYKNQSQNGTYPKTLPDLLTKKYVTDDSLASPNSDDYIYVPLARQSSPGVCTYYHLGVNLELPSGQIDTADNFSSEKSNGVNTIDSGGYVWCTGYSGSGINGDINEGGDAKMYDVRP
jgi:prepilin-type N-terminal cleavage/methylation domain-containing protein